MDASAKWYNNTALALDEETANRWCSFGPYYAMFPVDFARKVISTYSAPGDLVLDPFCGRGTSIFCAGEVGRDGFGIEINPVGWLYAKVKLNPAKQRPVEARLKQIGKLASLKDRELKKLPKFFHKCFCPEVLSFLLACRRNLRWRNAIARRSSLEKQIRKS